MFHMSEKPKIQEIQIIYHATTRWPLSGLGAFLGGFSRYTKSHINRN